jgi:hypothetical protein
MGIVALMAQVTVANAFLDDSVDLLKQLHRAA